MEKIAKKKALFKRKDCVLFCLRPVYKSGLQNEPLSLFHDQLFDQRFTTWSG